MAPLISVFCKRALDIGLITITYIIITEGNDTQIDYWTKLELFCSIELQTKLFVAFAHLISSAARGIMPLEISRQCWFWVSQVQLHRPKSSLPPFSNGSGHGRHLGHTIGISSFLKQHPLILFKSILKLIIISLVVRNKRQRQSEERKVGQTDIHACLLGDRQLNRPIQRRRCLRWTQTKTYPH